MSVLGLSVKARSLRLSASAPRWLGPAFVFAAAFLVFTPSFGAYFAVLDFNHIQAVRFTKAGLFFHRIFDPSDGGRNVIGTGELFRPVYYSVYWLEYHVFGFHPRPYYMFNATIHASNAALLWLLAWRVTRWQLAATAGALIWALHPQYADTVAWISSTTDLLLVFFGLSAVLLYSFALDSTGRRRWALIAASTAAALAALGAKESGVAVVGVICLYHLLFHRPARLDRYAIPWTLLPLLLILAFYLPLRAALVGNLAERGDHSLFSSQAMSNIHVLSGLAAGPFAGQTLPNSDFSNAQGAMGIVLIAGTVLAVVLGSRREWFFAGWYYIALVPYLVLGPVWIVGRYLYLPNIGLAMLAGLGVSRATELLSIERVGAYGRQIAAAALLTAIAVWFVAFSLSFQGELTAKGSEAQAFLTDLKATYPVIPSGSRLILTDSPRSLSLAPNDGYMLRPAVHLAYGTDVEVITPLQLDAHEVPPPNDRDLWYPPR